MGSVNKIVGLKAVDNSNQRNEHLIALLEAFLEEARKGDITSIAGITIRPNQDYDCFMVSDMSTNATTVLGGLTVLKSEIIFSIQED